MRLRVAALARSLAFAAITLPFTSPSGVAAIEPETTQQYLDKADALLSSGKYQEALGWYDQAVQKDDSNYLSYFKRATTRLSLGKTSGALDDFAKILQIKPDFDQALYQRAKIYTKEGQYTDAINELDKYLRNNKNDPSAKELKGKITTSQSTIIKAQKALDSKSFDECVQHASEVIDLSPNLVQTRSIRASCHLGAGRIEDAVSDFSRAANLNPNDAQLLAKLAHIQYFALYNPDQALGAIKSCLHYDPEQKECKATFRKIKKLEKNIVKSRNFMDGGRWQTAVNLLDPTSAPDDGLLAQVQVEHANLVAKGDLTQVMPNVLHTQLLTMLCKAYNEMNNPKKSKIYCERLLMVEPDNLEGLIGRGDVLMSEEGFEDAVRVLNKAREATGGQDRRVNERLMKAQRLLKQSTSKDYYKVLGIPRDSDKAQIKKAYRKMGKQFHPDKYRGPLAREDVEKKMASINEAYEVLSNDELRARFDNGDDPNDPAGGAGHGGNPFHHHGGGQPFHFQGFPGGGFPFGGGGQQGFQFKFNF